MHEVVSFIRDVCGRGNAVFNWLEHAVDLEPVKSVIRILVVKRCKLSTFVDIIYRTGNSVKMEDGARGHPLANMAR